MEILEKLKKDDCCGCSSCMQKCPKGAITMKENEEGFLYPEIDQEKCVNCEMCIKACPQLKSCTMKKKIYPIAYAVYNKNLEELLKSSSGGMFSVLANYVIEKQGIVVGAAYDENNIVRHICVENKEELEKIRGSKYVQSDINNTYKIAEQKLKDNKLVLYTGTPCQISGLKAYLGKEYENLILVDVVCHGVPSPKLFQTYLNWLEGKLKSKVNSYNFRSKEKKGWGLTAKVVTDNGNTKYISSEKDPYYDNFLECKTYRKSCYQCHYTSFIRESDITLADYWGILSVHPDFYSERGVSLIIVNNKKGEKLFNELADKIVFAKTDLEKAARKNINLKRPSREPVQRKEIYNGLKVKNAKQYIDENLKITFNIKKKIKSMVPYQVKLMVKNIRRRK